jgi:DNA-binding transcriptional LysR family regulator
MDIQDMCIFARVAAVQNLSAVGTELGLTPGTISKRIQALEDELRVRLFDRTTRSIRITEEGAKFLTHVERILAEIEGARAAVSANVEQPKGRVKISAPASLSRFIEPAICAFMRLYPDIDVHIDLSDRIVNLQEEGYDMVVRSGALIDSNLIAKRLAPDRQIIAASSAYLMKYGTPQRPDELSDHSCLILGDASQWTFERNGREISVRVGGRLRSNNGDLLRHAAMEGYGLIRTSELRVAPYIKSGALCRVLPDYDVAAFSAVWALYPKSKYVLPKLRVLLDFLGDWFRDVSADTVESPAEIISRSRPSADARAAGLLRTRVTTAATAANGLTRGNGSAS